MKRYRAFISYSHKDEKIAAKLHRYIEQFRIPKKMEVKWSQGSEAVSRRIFPVFRDKDELPSSADLGAQIETALKISDFLVVVCSPDSAQSHWVNEEILTFKRMGKASNILALIVSGEPNAEEKTDVPNNQECFPDGLKYAVDTDGNLQRSVRMEPIAADCRKGTGNTSDAFMKIVAGLLGVGYDELKQREIKRKQRFAYLIAGVALAVVLLTGTLSIIAIRNANAFKEQKIIAEENEKIALRNEEEARRQREIAEENEEEANLQKEIAHKNEEEAIFQRTIAEQKKLEAQREREATERQLIINLIRRGNRETEMGNIQTGTAFYAKADAISDGHPMLKKTTSILYEGWKQSFSAPYGLISSSYVTVHPIDSGRTGDELRYIEVPGRLVTLEAEGRKTVRVLPSPLKGVSFMYHQGSNQVLEYRQKEQDVRIRSLDEEMKLICSVPVDMELGYIWFEGPKEHFALMSRDSRKLQLFSYPQGELVLEKEAEERIFAYVTYAGERIILGYSDGSVEIIGAGGTSEAELTALGKHISGILSSPNNRYLLIQGEEQVLFYNLETGYRFPLFFESIIVDYHFTQKGDHFLIADSKGNIFSYKIDEPVILHRYYHYPRAIIRFRLNGKDNLVAALLQGNMMKVNHFPSWLDMTGNIDTREEYGDIGFIEKSIYLYRSGEYVLWKLPQLYRLEGRRHPKAAYLENKKQLVSIVAGRGLYLSFDEAYTGQGAASTTFTNESGNGPVIPASLGTPLKLVVSSEEDLVYVTTVNGELYYFDLTERSYQKLYASMEFLGAFDVSPGSRYLALGTDSGVFLLFDLHTGRSLGSVAFTGTRVSTIGFSPDGEYVSVGLLSGRVIVYHLKTLEAIINTSLGSAAGENWCGSSAPYIDFNPVVTAFSQDGRYFAAGGLIGDVFLYDLHKQEWKARHNVGRQVSALSWDNSSTALYAGSVEGTVRRITPSQGLDPSFSVDVSETPKDIVIPPDEAPLIVTTEGGALWVFEKHFGYQMGLPYTFSYPPQVLFYDKERSLCRVFIGELGIFDVHLLLKDPISFRDLTGLFIDEDDTLRTLSLEETLKRNGGLGEITKHNILEVLRITPQFDEEDKEKDEKEEPAEGLDGKWTGVGQDVGVSNWNFTLDIEMLDERTFRGTFTWYRGDSGRGAEKGYAGKEKVRGEYIRKFQLLKMRSVEIDSTTGIGGSVWYKAYLNDDMTRIEHGVWGRYGHYWGIWSGKKGER
jgi:WD40 repeat protein